MRPKRTFFRAERVRVVPPEGESPPQAPPEALPAAGVRRRVCFGGRARDSIWQLPGPRRGWLAVLTPEQQSSPGLRLGPGGLGLSLPC
jgi:hypothetical protein